MKPAYIMKSHKLAETAQTTLYNYCLYCEGWSYLGGRDLTPKQAEKLRLTSVSPMQVYTATDGTMGFRNLPDNVKARIKENVFRHA